MLAIQQFAELPSLAWALCAVPFAVAAWFRPVWLVPLCFIAGAAWADFRAGLILEDALPAHLEGRDLVVEGRIADIPQRTDFGQRFEFDVARTLHEGKPVAAPARILLTLRGYEPALRAGAGWRFTVRLTQPHGFQNPGGFDYEAHLFRKRVRARGYVRDDPRPQHLGEDGALASGIDRLRQRVGDQIAVRLEDRETAGLVVALANGDSRGVSEAQWDVFRRSGTLHLVAISGLHITLVGGIAFLLLRWLWALPGITVLRLPAPVAGALGAVVAATGYAAMAGFVVPTQRALIMLAVAMAALVWRRRLKPTQVLAIALLLVLVHDPLAVMASGFWLSFAAVGVIFLVAGHERGRFAGWRKWSHLQWAITVGMLPLSLILFRQVSLVAPIANMLAVPVFDLLAVPLTLAGIVALPLFPDSVAEWCFEAAALALQSLWPALDWLAAGDGVMWSQPPPPLWALVCGLVGAALLLAPRGFPGRWVGAAWMLPMLFVRPPGPSPGELWFTLLDVGQGSAAVVRTAGHALVFDAGPSFGPTFDTGEAVVVPYLRETGAGVVDVLMVSHGGSDHLGGGASLRRDWRVRRVVTSVPERFDGAEACIAGTQWEWDGVEFTILAPPAGEHGEANDASCVLRVRTGNTGVLLTGDIEAARERRLLREYGADLASDVLLVPHHGSRTSSTRAWVETVQPRFALFSVGYRNRFRHPHPAVTARYRDAGATPLQTPDTGALEFRSVQGAWTWSSYRSAARRYWLAPARAAAVETAPAQP